MERGKTREKWIIIAGLTGKGKKRVREGRRQKREAFFLFCGGRRRRSKYCTGMYSLPVTIDQGNENTRTMTVRILRTPYGS